MTAVQAPFPLVVIPPDERDGPPAGIIHPERCLHRPAVRVEVRHRQGIEVGFLGEDVAEGVGPVGRGRQFPKLVAEPLEVLGPPRIVTQFLAEIEIQGIAPLHHPRQLDGGIHPRPPLETGPERVHGRLVFLGGLGRQGQARGEQCGGDEKGLAHQDLLSFRMSMIQTKALAIARARRSALKSARSPIR